MTGSIEMVPVGSHEDHRYRTPHPPGPRLRPGGVLLGAGRPDRGGADRRGPRRDRRDRYQSLGRPGMYPGPRHPLHGPGACEEMLIGSDPMQPEAIWQTALQRLEDDRPAGALICALGAIDIALWDIKAQALGVPVWKLLGDGPRPRHPLRLAPADRADPPGPLRLARRQGQEGEVAGLSRRQAGGLRQRPVQSQRPARGRRRPSSRSSPSAAARSVPTSS